MSKDDTLQPITNRLARMSVIPPTTAKRPSLYSSGAATRRPSEQPNRRATMMVNNPRSSLLPGGNSNLPAVNRQDPRPFRDPAYFQDSLHKLWEFLTVNEYPNSITQEQLKNPTMKEFSALALWMYSLLDNMFKINDLGNDLPKIFKNLGYPFALSKSMILSAGAKHNWPILLAAISWLREIYEYLATRNEDLPVGCFTFRRLPPEYHPFWDFGIKSYHYYLKTGQMRNESLLKELENRRDEDHMMLMEIINEFNRKKKKLEYSIAELENDPNGKAVLENKLKLLQSDHQKFTSIISSYKGHLPTVEKKLQQYIQLHKEMNQKLQDLQAEEHSLEMIIRDQEKNGLQKLSKKCSKLRETVQQADQTLKTVMSTKPEIESQYSNLHDSCQKDIIIINQLGVNGYLNEKLFQIEPKIELPIETYEPKVKISIDNLKKEIAISNDNKNLLLSEIESLKVTLECELLQDKSVDDEIKNMEKHLSNRKSIYDNELKVIRDKITQLRKIEESKMITQQQLPPKSKTVDQAKTESEEIIAQLNYKSTQELTKFFMTLEKINNWKITYKEQLQSLLREVKGPIN